MVSPLSIALALATTALYIEKLEETYKICISHFFENLIICTRNIINNNGDA